MAKTKIGNRAGHALKIVLETAKYAQRRFSRNSKIALSTLNQWHNETEMKAGAFVKVAQALGAQIGREAVETFLSDTLGVRVSIREKDFEAWQECGPACMGYFTEEAAEEIEAAGAK